VTQQDSWGLEPGDRVTPELTATRLLGGGAAYEAFLAFDEITYGPVVAKVVRPAQVSDEGTLRGLRREVETLERVSHPAVVRSLRAELDGPRPHVVLEHLDGPRLSTLVRRYGALEPAQYLPLGVEIASALHYLRRLELTHLDIKPGNVIMGAPAKLIDLSIARPVRDAARLTTPVGTDAAMAPEQADPGRSGTIGPATDVWGLGVTLFEAAAGFKAFAAGDPQSDDPAVRCPQLTDEPRALPDHVPAVVAELVGRCLAFAPEDRPTPAEVADTVAPVLAALPKGRLGGFKVGLSR
jgi:serine/threonine protein kinase